MSDVKSLVSELLQLLVADLDFSKLFAKLPPSRFSNAPRPSIPNNPLAALSKHSLWSRIDQLLFPYLSYNMKLSMVPPERSSYSLNQSHKHPTLLDSFVKANITSESAALYSASHLLPIALYEAVTNELLQLALYDQNSFNIHPPFLFPIHSTRRPAKQIIYSIPGIGSISNSPSDLPSQQKRLQNIMTSVTVHFRRLSKSRLQARCTIPTLSPTSSDSPQFDLVWESSSLSDSHSWRLRRFGFADSDDEEHYWRPWESSLEMAEHDYAMFQQQDYKSELVPLHVADIDWEGMTNGTTPTDEDSLSTLSTANNHLSLPTINNSNVPAKDQNPVREVSNGVFYEARKNNPDLKKQKILGKQIGAGRGFYYSPDVDGGDTNSTISNTISNINSNTIPNINSNINSNTTTTTDPWGYDDHHNHYESLEIDYEDDYSYKQSHPVFQHPISNTVCVDSSEDDVKEWVDDDDLFGVCHSMPVAPISKQQKQDSDYSQLPANATATRTQPVTEPLLQRVCDGDDDDEAAYWDRYDSFV